jgi:hypothetical protein
MSQFKRSHLNKVIASFDPTVYPRVFEPYEKGNVGPNFGAFNPQTNLYEFTPEGQNFKEYFKEKTGGLNLNILPMALSETVKPNNQVVGGYFMSHGPGGSTDPANRNLHLNPANQEDFFTVAHEAGHAKDPSLAKKINHFFTKEKSPTDFLNNYININPMARSSMISETEAQRAAIESMAALGIPSGANQGDPWFKGYPASYIDESLLKVREMVTAPARPKVLFPESYANFHQQGTIPTYFSSLEPSSPVQREIDLTDARTKKVLNLALDQVYRNKEQQILDNTQKYINDRLGY